MGDLLMRGGTLVTPTGIQQADIRIEDGVIVELGRELSATAAPAIDVHGLTVLPGLIDVHVHFNEPGRTEWEGTASGSRALAAGGGTTCFDMPLNSTPCTVTRAAVADKRAAFEASSIVDFGLWGGLVPGHVEDMPALAEAGVVGFKAFMCDSGLPEFPHADRRTLRAGMVRAQELGLPVAVHAESASVITAARDVARGTDARAFLASRPLEAELEAIAEAVELAGDTGARLHIVHVSSGRGVALAAEARNRGVDVSIETCAHYLAFTAEDLERLGVVAKCAPPLRPADEQNALWATVRDGRVDIVASDHSPSVPEMKQPGDFEASWGGIAGVQSTLAVLLDATTLPLGHLAALVATTPAHRFRIARKGAIAVGYDADLVCVDRLDTWTLRRGDLEQRHPSSPYVGRQFRGRVHRTIRRGDTIFADGRITARAGGRFIRPSAAPIS